MEFHIDKLPLKSNYVILKDDCFNIIINGLLKKAGSTANASRITGISKSVIGRYVRKENVKIRIDSLIKICEAINISLEKIEKHIIWIGNVQSRGIIHPKLPFELNSRAATRVIAAICNDGWISDGMYYSNTSETLRESVRNDVQEVFGGDNRTVKLWIKETDQYLSFPSIIRDVFLIITEFKGIKSENNPEIPSFILNSTELMLGWIEQTIADEGHVKHYPGKFRREIVWRRSFKKDLSEYKLNRDEIKILKELGIKYDVKTNKEYMTKRGIKKVQMQIRISNRMNLQKLRSLIVIPDMKKDKIFADICTKYKRYRIPIQAKEAIIKLDMHQGFFTSKTLGACLPNKSIGAARYWIRYYLRDGFIYRVDESLYGSGIRGRKYAKYALSKP
ncbi:MAG: helix-turn-helix transcriptional regulator [Nanoarchaeota archaeon]|nr:helix-turn-helix transcriptional regulator [Nanoarchaeota archaeon]